MPETKVDTELMAHLLRRAGFGPTREEFGRLRRERL